LVPEASGPLGGRRILVTRPREQSGGLARLIGEAGGRAIVFPALEIEELPPPAALQRLHEFELAVFVSPTAVAQVFKQLRSWPQALPTAAVGPGTRRALERHGVKQVISPREGADSEALLAELEQVNKKRIVIFRGEHGRALLGDTLSERGAQVEYAACYRRVLPKALPIPGKMDAVTVSSAQGLDNLFELLDAGELRATPTFVAHERIAAQARRRGVEKVIVAGASDEEMRECLVAYFASHG
jgi:uroporphyrinogen-III synthase